MTINDLKPTDVGIIKSALHRTIQNNDRYDSWYCGTTSDPMTRVFSSNGHNVTDEQYNIYLAYNNEDAREVENHFHDLGLKGASTRIGGSYVYIYKISNNTKE